MKKGGRRDTPYPPTTTNQLDTPDLHREIFGDSEEESSASSKKLRSGDGYVTPASPPWSEPVTPAFPATPSSVADEEDEAKAFLGKEGYEAAKEKIDNERLVASPAIPNNNKQTPPLFCFVFIGNDSIGPTHILFSKPAAWNNRAILGKQINYISESFNPSSFEQFDKDSEMWSVMGKDKDNSRCVTIVSVSDMPGDTLKGKCYILCSNLIAFNLYYYIEKIKVWKNFVTHFNRRPAVVQHVRATDRDCDILNALKQVSYMNAKQYDETLFNRFFVNL